VKSRDNRKNISAVLHDVEPEDLIKYGLIPGVRRPPAGRRDPGHELDDDALIQILVEPKNALVKQYQRMFAMEGVELEIREEALQAISKKASPARPGRVVSARSWSTSFSTSCSNCRPWRMSQKVVIDDGSVTGDVKPILLYADPPKVAGSAAS
jgi:ATP-dependent Clp protease ATP-binding subunit ClpX